MEIKATGVLKKMIATDKRFILSVGSSRSSKTYSIYQWIWLWCLERKGQGRWISIVRKSMPSLKRSVLREFISFLESIGEYSDRVHNKSSQIIEVQGNFVEFFSLDNYEKIKGAKRDVAYLNEVTEIDYEAANQIFLRTRERIIMDMNPSDTFHWVWNMREREDLEYIHSTYLDNPFLEPQEIAQIESYREVDENYWRIYGLGLPGVRQTTIYSHWTTFRDAGDIISTNWGLDIGYNHKTALIKCQERADGALLFTEEFVSSGLTTGDIISEIERREIKGHIWCDSARPDMIEDLRRKKILAKGAEKAVSEGIIYLKSKKMLIHEESTSILEELRHYRWKSAGELIGDEPVKINDDCMDAMRYAAYSSRSKTSRGVPFKVSEKSDDKKRYFM